MKINITNAAALSAALYAATGKAHTHTHTDAQVRRDAEALYDKLCRHLPKRLLVGSVLKLSSRPNLPKAYGNRRVIHTEVTVEICPTGLFVTHIAKVEDWSTGSPGASAWAILPEPVKEALKAALYVKAIQL